MTLESEKYTEDNRDKDILAENWTQKNFYCGGQKVYFLFLGGKTKD